MYDQKSTDELKRMIQAQIVDLITRRLEQGQMTPERAKEIASMILEKLSANLTEEELLQVVPKLDDHFDELSSIVLPIMLDYEKRMREEINAKIENHLKQKNFDQVLQLTKEAIEKERQLT